MLHREIFPAAKGPADRVVPDDNLLLGEGEHLRDLLAVLVEPLARRLDDDPAIGLDPCGAGFGLEVGMLLPRGAEFALQNHVSRGEPGGEITASHRHLEQEVAIEVLVEQRGERREGGVRVENARQWLVRHLHVLGGSMGRLTGGRDHEGDLVPEEPDRVRAEDRLVMIDEAEGVVRDIGGGEDCHDSRHRTRGVGRHPEDARMGMRREDHGEMQRVGIDLVRRVRGRSRDFAQRIMTGQRLPDDRLSGHDATCPLASRTASRILR